MSANDNSPAEELPATGTEWSGKAEFLVVADDDGSSVRECRFPTFSSALDVQRLVVSALIPS